MCVCVWWQLFDFCSSLFTAVGKKLFFSRLVSQNSESTRGEAGEQRVSWMSRVVSDLFGPLEETVRIDLLQACSPVQPRSSEMCRPRTLKFLTLHFYPVDALVFLKLMITSFIFLVLRSRWLSLHQAACAWTSSLYGASSSLLISPTMVVQDWSGDTAPGNTSVEDDGGGCGGAHPDMLGSVSQEILDAQTKGGSKLHGLRFVDQSAGTDGIKC